MSALDNLQDVDVITLPVSGNIKAKRVSLSVSCELMKNQQQASPIEPTKNILVVQDSNGKPMIFTIGTDEKFHLIKYDESSATGWTVVDLSAGFTGYAAAKVFEVTQDIKGRISVVLAVSKPNASNTDIFVASMLSNDYSQTDWSKFSALCTRVSGIDPNFIAEKIRMGKSDDGKAPFIIITGDIKGEKYYYQVDGSNETARRFEFPENVSSDPNSMMDLSIGYAFGQRGIYFLYRIGEAETLECTTLPTPDEGSEHYDYSPGNQKIPEKYRNLKYNCIATPTGSQTDPLLISSDIYVGTDKGVYLFRDAKINTLDKVTDKIEDVHEIIVREDEENISVWVLSSPSTLYYIYGKKGQSYTWHDPILFSQSIIHIAPIRNRAKGANELFLINQDQSISHYWQDPNSTLWQQRTIKVKGKNFLLDFDSFTTQIHLEDENGTSLPNQTLKITSSEWVYATVNGLVYSIDKDNPAEIQTDIMGNVTIITMATDVSVPIFHVEADFFDKTLNIYPNGKVEKGLKSVKTGDDLKNARTQDGQPVLSQSYDPATLDGVAYNISQLIDSSSQFVVGTKSDTNTFVSVEDRGVKHTGELNVAHLPENFAFGMKLENGVWKPHTVSDVAMIGVGGIEDDIISWAGDLLHYIDEVFEEGIKLIEKGVTYLKDGVSFVIKKVEDGLMLVLTLPDKLLNIALKTLSSVFKALSWILKLIRIALTKILAWLGHLFGWDDIWKTHKVIASMVTSGLNYAIRRTDTEIEKWRKSVDSFFEEIDQKIKNAVVPEQMRSKSPKAMADEQRQKHPNINLLSPPANWVFYQIQHGGLLLDDLGLPKSGFTQSSRNNPLTQFINDVVTPTVSNLVADVKRDISDLKRILTDQSMTIQDVFKLLSDLVDTVIEPIRTLVNGLLKFAQDMLNDIKHGLEDTLDIQFLSELYKWITFLLDDEEDLTVINATALLISIPYTYIYKGVKGHAPFSDSTYGLDDPNLFNRLLGAPTPSPQYTVVSGLKSAHAEAAAASAGSQYSKIGGMIGAFIGIVNAFSTAIAAYAGQGLLTKILNKINACLLVARAFCTLPLPRDLNSLEVYQKASEGEKRQISDRVYASYYIKVAAYVFGLCYAILSFFITEPKVRGGSLAIFDAIIGGLSVVSDSLGASVEGYEEWYFVFPTDTISNVGGCLKGISALVVEDDTKMALLALGTIGGMAGGIIGFIQAFIADEGDIVHLVNVGG